MKNNEIAAEATEVAAVHPMKKSYTLISTKHVDYNKLTAVESVAMSLAFVLSISFSVLYAAQNVVA